MANNKKYFKKISSWRTVIQIISFILIFYGILSKELMFIVFPGIALLFSNFFCGWICPYGAFQDLMHWTGEKIKIHRYHIPSEIHKYLKYLRYIIFILILAGVSSLLVFEDIRGSFFTLTLGYGWKPIAWVGVLGFGVLFLFSHRFFCRYLCPVGAKLGLFSMFRFMTIKRDEKTCVDCKKCSKICPMNIDVHEVKNMANPHCVSCFRCIDNCPKKSLKFGFRNYFKKR